MIALHPEGLKAAKAIYRSEEGEPNRVEKVLAAYLAIAHPAPVPSPEEGSRFVGVDGVPMVSVVVARSVPFARALVHEWSLLDGRNRDHMLKFKGISLPAAIYDAILPKVRNRLRPGGLDE